MTFVELSEILGNIGEFVGSVAVLVTLIYLAVQVRHGKQLLEENRKIALGQVSQTNAGFRMNLQRYLADPRILEVREKVEEGDAVYSEAHKENFDQLSAAEKMLWKGIQAQYAIMHDDGLYQASLGLMDDQDREILERGVKQSVPYWQYFDNYIPSRLQSWYETHKDS
jgi:hypothetical protein